MKLADFNAILLEVARNRDRPAWLLPFEAVEFSTIEGPMVSDGFTIRGTLVSTSRWRVAQHTISGRLTRIYHYTKNKSLLIGPLFEILNTLEATLRCTINHPLQDMAFQALNDDDVLAVFMDRLLLRGEIAVDDPEAQALGFARSIVAPFMFTEWQTTRWPVNEDYRPMPGDLRLFGDGPVVHAKSDVDWRNCTIRVQGDIALID